MPRRVLVVARPYEGEVIRRGLAEAGYDAQTVRPEVDDRREVETGRPDVVVLALRAAPAAARARIERLRAGEHGRWVPIALIADPDRSGAAATDPERVGADRILTRPLDLSALNACVATLLEDRAMEFASGGATRTLTGLPSGEVAAPTLDADARERVPTSVEPAVGHAAALPRGPAASALQTGIEAADLLVSALAGTTGGDLLARLGGPGARLRLTAAGEGEVDRAGMGMAERVTAGLLDGQRTLEEVIDTAPLDPGDTLRLVYALSLLGAVSLGARPPQEGEAATEEEIRARHALAREGDYFAILGVERDAARDAILAAHRRARAAFDPARLPGDLAHRYGAEIADIVFVVDEACRVLADDRRRAAYRRAIG